mgnify:CR=1 FL=1
MAKRYIGEETEKVYLMTIGVEFHSKIIEVLISNFKFKLNLMIWDIGGQERWYELRPSFYLGSSGAILVYDVTRDVTYRNIEAWADEFVKKVGVKPMVLVGNKIDLRDKIPSLRLKDGLLLASKLSKKYGIEVPYHETSALLGINVNRPFEDLVRLIINMFISKSKTKITK